MMMRVVIETGLKLGRELGTVFLGGHFPEVWQLILAGRPSVLWYVDSLEGCQKVSVYLNFLY